MQVGLIVPECTTLHERTAVLLEVPKVDVETNHARAREEIAPDCKASSFEYAELGNR
jgi:hypothetical protein